MSVPDKDRLASTWGDEVASVNVAHNDGQDAYFTLDQFAYNAISTEIPEAGTVQVSVVDNEDRNHKFTYFNVEHMHVIYADEE